MFKILVVRMDLGLFRTWGLQLIAIWYMIGTLGLILDRIVLLH
jgi:hypothetical protein